MRATVRPALFYAEAALLLGVMLLALAGCGTPSVSDDRPIDEKYRVAWQKLSDGSSFASIEDRDNHMARAKRCWPDGSGFSCLEVTKNDVIFGIVTVSKKTDPALSPIMLPFGESNNGYSCEYALDPLEKIERNGKALTSNKLHDLDDRWGQAHVRKYMADNHVLGHGWFRCLEVLRAVLGGSLETLGTTSVTKAMLGRQ